MRILRSHTRGSAMVIALVAITMIMGIVTMLFMQSWSTTRGTDRSIEYQEAKYAAQAGLELAVKRLWGDYVAVPGNKDKVVADYRTWLEQTSGIGLQNGQSVTLPSLAAMPMGGAQVESVQVARVDDGTKSTLTLTSTGLSGDGTRALASEVISVASGQAPFKGFAFAVLANNVNCIMCHARIQNLNMAKNTDPAKFDTFDRVKVGTLESLLIRSTSANSVIGGTIYTRGIVVDKSGVPISLAGTTVTGYEFNVAPLDPNTVKQDPATGDAFSVPLSPAGVDGNGNLLPGANLYPNYPADTALQTDGELPTNFPAPFPDDNLNKKLDDSEFLAIASKANGSLSGGNAYAVSPGGTYSATTLPAAGNTGPIAGTHTGNLILTGTAGNPIKITGTVVVDGDLVISGKVEGTGQIWARGNIYVAGPLTYNNKTVGGVEEFGVAPDGSQNLLAITSGKNILVGDYITTGKGITAPETGDASDGTGFGFTMSEVTLFNRAEWTKTQPTLNGQPNAMYKGPNYIPRYYVMNPGNPVWLFAPGGSGAGKNETLTWDNNAKMWQGSEHATAYTDVRALDPAQVAADAAAGKAVLMTLNPTNNWISAANMQAIIQNVEAAQPAGQPLRLDGLVYSNNSIFNISRSASVYAGRMEVNGAIVAADLGLLIPGQKNKKSKSSSDPAVIQSDLDKAKADLAKAQQDLAKAEADLAKAKKKKDINKLKKKVNDLKKEIDNLNQKIADLEKALADALAAQTGGGGGGTNNLNTLSGVGLSLNYDPRVAAYLKIKDPQQKGVELVRSGFFSPLRR